MRKSQKRQFTTQGLVAAQVYALIERTADEVCALVLEHCDENPIKITVELLNHVIGDLMLKRDANADLLAYIRATSKQKEKNVLQRKAAKQKAADIVANIVATQAKTV